MNTVPKFNNCFASHDGKLFFSGKKGLQEYKSFPDRNGHLRLRVQGKNSSVADLVLSAFGKPRPKGHIVNYKDGNKSNISVLNIYWSPRIITKLPLGVLVDDDDFEELKRGGWGIYYAGKKRYAVIKRTLTSGKTERILLHRFILNAPNTFDVAHLNGNGLDCRKANLSLATKTDNAHSYKRKPNGEWTSKYRGVSRDKKCRSKPWKVMFGHLGKKRYLGMFKTEEEAAKAYDDEVLKLYGKFAHLNFPEKRSVVK